MLTIAKPAMPFLRKRPLDRLEPEVVRLKFITFKGGPLGGQVNRIPREHDRVGGGWPSYYRDSGELESGYPRFDFVEATQ
jgi:hypothetical protein